MKKNKSSTTAEGMALVRAIESSRPEEKRICHDPIARKLVNPASVLMAKLMIDSGLYARMATPGAIEFILTRERYIDDFIKTCLSEEFEQVVILGAGFDTRAWRIPGIEKTRVFEVDHPATQAVKLKRLEKAIGPLPEHVAFVPVDFNTQDLAARLGESGYNRRLKTLFIWQGVVMYLTAEGVDSTLAFISNHSAQGSAVIFDYFYTETLQAMKMESTHRMTRAIGENLIFGIGEGQIESFLSNRGFEDIRNADARELMRLYLTGVNAGRMIASGAAIASARVKGK